MHVRDGVGSPENRKQLGRTDRQTFVGSNNNAQALFARLARSSTSFLVRYFPEGDISMHHWY